MAFGRRNEIRKGCWESLGNGERRPDRDKKASDEGEDSKRVETKRFQGTVTTVSVALSSFGRAVAAHRNRVG